MRQPSGGSYGRHKIPRLGFAAIVTALITLLVITAVCFQDWQRYGNANSGIHQARAVLSLNETVLDRVRDAETGQRGFLSTGRPEYLAPYQSAISRLPSELNELAELLKQDSEQSKRFEQLQLLIDEKLAELRSTIELRESQQTAAALALVETDQGKQTMDRIRRVSDELQNTETARWAAAWDDLDKGAGRLRIVTLLGAVLLAALVSIGGGAMKRAAEQMQQLIIELNRSKQSAEQDREALRATVYSIGDAVITTDRAGAVQMMNTVAERLTGYSEHEARGIDVERILRIVHESTREQVDNPVRRVIQHGQPVGLANHTVLIPKAGSEVPIDDSAAPIKRPDGAVSGAVLVFRDISERRRAFETARQLASIVANSDDAIIGKSLQGIVTSWNRGAERLFGYSAGEMIGAPIARLIPPDRLDDMTAILERVGQGESVEHYVTERMTKDGRRLLVSLTVSPIRDQQGHVVAPPKSPATSRSSANSRNCYAKPKRWRRWGGWRADSRTITTTC